MELDGHAEAKEHHVRVGILRPEGLMSQFQTGGAVHGSIHTRHLTNSSISPTLLRKYSRSAERLKIDEVAETDFKQDTKAEKSQTEINQEKTTVDKRSKSIANNIKIIAKRSTQQNSS